MKHWKIIVSFLAVFLAGGVVGGVISARIAHQMLFEPPAPEEMAERLMNRLNKDLKLTPEQKPKVAEIVKRTANLMSATHHEMLDRLITNMDLADEEIVKLLTPEQRPKFDRFVAERPTRTQRK